jgi:hypothetical protein
MKKRIIRVFQCLLCVVLIAQLIGCGTIFYPNRIGQKGGNLDPVVTVLDAVCLVFFIIPGVVAFAVDFVNGTIYLPGGRRSSLDINGYKEVKFDPDNCTPGDIEKIIKQETGCSIKLDQQGVKVYSLKSAKDMDMFFAMFTPDTSMVLSMK